jgi:asparagine synthase (glutamine-hydrolysing)
MCGIIAISAPNVRPFDVDLALDAISHRGPDDRGVVFPAADTVLGHVRLSIVDLTNAGHQPMWDHSKNFIIAYNGEIYNFLELKGQLEKRHGPIPWLGRSDTEVIVEGFAREGISFLSKLNGMFAISIYDRMNELLHVIRDPLGIKPLVATEQNGAILFCSEAKGLLAVPNVKRTLRIEALAEQLAFMYVPEPRTLFEEFYKVEPGVCFSYRKGRLIKRTPMFEWLNDAPSICSEYEAIEVLRTAFATAVDRQILADVPVSLFLSGGLDSSAVADQAMRSGAAIHDAYTIAFSHSDLELDGQSDDLYYARSMAKRLGIELKVIEAHPDLLLRLPDLAIYMEDGFSDPSALNTYLICAAARQQGVKVMLSGQGADEFLGGYRRYLAERAIRRMPRALRDTIFGVSTILPAGLPGPLNALNRRMKRFGSHVQQSLDERMLGYYTWATPAQINGLFKAPLALGFREDFQYLLEQKKHRNDGVDLISEIDRRYDLLSLNLTYTDRMSMATGVEVRVPFLDFDLVRAMNSIPSRLKVKGVQGKYIFKKAMELHLPRKIVYRQKAGFGLPIRAWVGKPNELIDHYLNRARIADQGIFSPDAIEQIRSEQANGAADHANTLLTLLTQQLVLERVGVSAK